jgi:hypothetical protein
MEGLESRLNDMGDRDQIFIPRTTMQFAELTALNQHKDRPTGVGPGGGMAEKLATATSINGRNNGADRCHHKQINMDDHQLDPPSDIQLARAEH